LLRHGAAVGRRHHRPGRHAPRSGPGTGRRAPRPRAGREVRRVPHVTPPGSATPVRPMDPTAHFTQLARYHAWATARLLDAVALLPEDGYRRGVGLFFGSLHGTLNHLLVAEHLLWFVRFAEGASPRVALDAEVERDRARLDARLRTGAARWEPLIASWPAARWEGSLDYTTMRGVQASLPFAATLVHVFNHGTHHRGQITAALTSMGYLCPEIDLVYMLIEENQPA